MTASLIWLQQNGRPAGPCYEPSWSFAWDLVGRCGSICRLVAGQDCSQIAEQNYNTTECNTTELLYCRITILQNYQTTELLYCRITILQNYYTTKLLYYKITILQNYYATELLCYRITLLQNYYTTELFTTCSEELLATCNE